MSLDTYTLLRFEVIAVALNYDFTTNLEHLDPRNAELNKIELKVGRAVNLVKRIDQWGKQCSSHEQVLRGWWPGTVEEDEHTLMKGRVKQGDQGKFCHRLEKLVHLELADLSINEAYLISGFPNITETGGEDAGDQEEAEAQ